MRAKTAADNREVILKTLKNFGIEIDSSRLLEDQNPVISKYLDHYLAPLIPVLHSQKLAGTFWDNPQGIQFRNLLALCFAGQLSLTSLDTIWALLDEEDKIYYITTRDYGMGPLEIAARWKNLEGLKRLDAIYKEILNNYPNRIPKVHFGLLEVLKRFKEMEVKLNEDLFDYLLSMSNTLSTWIDPESTDKSILNKQFNCRFEGENFVSYERNTPLLEAFSDLFLSYFSENNTLGAKKLSQYLSSKLTSEQFAQFRVSLLTLEEDDDFKEYVNLNCLYAPKYAKSTPIPRIKTEEPKPKQTLSISTQDQTLFKANTVKSKSRKPETKLHSSKQTSSISQQDQTLFKANTVNSKNRTALKEKDADFELSCCEMVLIGCIPVVGWAFLLFYAIYRTCVADERPSENQCIP